MRKKVSVTVARGISLLVCAVMIFVSAGGLTVGATSVPIEHPMTVINKADLAIVKDRIANSIQPQRAAYNALITEANKELTFNPEPPISMRVRDGADLNPARNLMTANGSAAYTLALAWLYSIDREKAVQYANKAISIMKAWSDKSTYIYGSNPGLHTGSSFIGMIQAADILHDYSGWSQEDRKAFEDFWRTRVMPLQLQVLRGPRGRGNWGDHSGNALLVASVVFEDLDLRDELIKILYDQFDYPAPLTKDGWGDSDNRPKFQVNQGNDGKYYACLPHEATRTSGDTYMGINYHGFAFTSHSGMKETARYAGVDLYDEDTRYTDTVAHGRNTNMREVFEQYYRWNFLKEPVPGGSRFNWGNKTDIQYQASPNSVEIMYNNYYDTLTPEIKTAMASWLNSNRPVGNKGDGHATLNKGNIPVPAQEIVRAPSYSPHGGKFFGSRYVTITSYTKGADIYYTLDGSEPTTSSTRYEVPITINGTVTLKARAFKTGMTPSLLASEDYIKEALPDPMLVMGQIEADETTERLGNIVDAFKFTAPSGFLVTRLNVRFADSSTSGGGIRMALYGDDNGKPGALLGETGSFTAGPGIRSASLKVPYQLESGKDYWIATWLARSSVETIPEVPTGYEKATFISSSAGTRYSASARYYTDSTTQDNLTPFRSFPTGGSAFTESGSVTYAVYATSENDPKFYADTQLSITRKGKEAVAGLSFLNTLPEGEDRTALAVLGRYGEDGRLLDVIVKSYTIVAKANASGDTLTMPLEGGEHAKLFLWDQMNKMRPLLPAKRVNSLKSNQIYAIPEDGGFKVLGAIAADTFTSVAVTDEDNEIVYINQTKSDTEGNFEFFVPMTKAGEYYVAIGTPGEGPAMLTDITLSEGGSDE